ncbi:MAG: hypothetical protein ABH841_00785 [Candidatus Nealsonbacteria bacterium]
MATENEKVLAEAHGLYNEGKWHEAMTLLNNSNHGFGVEEMAEAYRLKGWCLYYIGIKGPAEEKREKLELAREKFDGVFLLTSDEKKLISAFNGLPLVYWILDEQKQAWRMSDQAIEAFPDEPSVWNTRSILFRWAKDFKGSAEVCEQVYKKALLKGDYRTAGNAKQNKADALKELSLIRDAKNEYAQAIGLYKQFESATGQSAKFHIEGVKKKALALYV